MSAEKSKKQVAMELGGMIGGVVGIISLISSAAGHYDDKHAAVIQQINEVIKVQAQHEVRLDAVERDNSIRDAANIRFQDQVSQQLNRMEDQYSQTAKDLRAQIDKVYDIVKGNKR
jgi:ArsR family metal-binding transcriptional regulator